MEVSKNGIELIKFFEGCRLVPYRDVGGVLTVGYGHLTNSTSRISQEQAEKFLISDLEMSEMKVNKQPYKFTQCQYDALVSFDFNTGKIDTLTGNGTRDLQSLPQYMKKYRLVNGKVVQGLVQRRNVECEVFNCSTLEELQSIFSRAKIPYSIIENKDYVVGNTYTLKSGMFVRYKPYGTVVAREHFTENAKEHDVNPKNGCLDAGTKVTCKGIEEMADGSVWIKIPSGYVCAFDGKKRYIE